MRSDKISADILAPAKEFDSIVEARVLPTLAVFAEVFNEVTSPTKVQSLAV